ncbi:hypothetical protein WKK05_29560 [Nostoc sp. UHCC 0302]|uniref:hypothetical protein n=1 Tax=Nostoc sp. UHCC 0302 TaxID=3134896 RepID=UPI00311CA6DE
MKSVATQIPITTIIPILAVIDCYRRLPKGQWQSQSHLATVEIAGGGFCISVWRGSVARGF